MKLTHKKILVILLLPVHLLTIMLIINAMAPLEQPWAALVGFLFAIPFLLHAMYIPELLKQKCQKENKEDKE